MSLHPVMVKLPKHLYNRVQSRAKLTKRSVESELLAVVAQAMEAEDELPDDLSTLLDELSLLEDKALWRAARGTMKSAEFAKLEKLQLKRQRGGLSEAESQMLDHLVHQYEKHMLVRARSAAILKQRGHDVSKLLSAE